MSMASAPLVFGTTNPPAPLRGPEAAESGFQHAAAGHVTKCSSGVGLKFAALKFQSRKVA